MSTIRVLVGTRKGAFILTADGKRKNWDVSGPHFAGWEIYHLKGSPAEPNRIYASQSSGWFGQIVQRSDDGGKTWHQPGTPVGEPAAPGPPKSESNRFAYDAVDGNRLPLISGMTGRSILGNSSAFGIWSRRSPIPIRFTPAWKMLRFSVRPMAERIGRNCPGLRGHGTGPQWQPGAGGMCLHTIVLDPSNAQRMWIAISAAGAFRTDDGGDTWKPINRGLKSPYIPDQDAEVGHCVHHVAMSPKRPGVLFMQKHWDVMRSDDAGDFWHEVSGNLPTDFGFAIDVHAHEPETVYVVPIKSDSGAFSSGWKTSRFP